MASVKKPMENRIKQTEEQTGNLVDAIAAVNRKQARLRDKGDTLAESLLSFAHEESVQKTTQTALRSTSEAVALLQDYRHALVSRCEVAIVAPLAEYGEICGRATALLQNKEKSRQTQQTTAQKLQQTKRSGTQAQGSHNAFEVTQMERSLQQQSVQTSHLEESLQQQMVNFEIRRTKDVKKTLEDWISVNLAFHAKAVQILTRTSAHVEAIDPRSDMVDFHLQLHPDLDPGSFPSVAASTPWNTPIATWGPNTLFPYTAGDDGGTNSAVGVGRDGREETTGSAEDVDDGSNGLREGTLMRGRTDQSIERGQRGARRQSSPQSQSTARRKQSPRDQEDANSTANSTMNSTTHSFYIS